MESYVVFAKNTGILLVMNKKSYTTSLLVLIIVALLTIGGIKLAHKNSTNRSSTTASQASSGTAVIDMQHKGLTEVDSAIYGKTSTTTLLLSYNSIQTLPSQMGKMAELTQLKIDHNQLKGSLIGEVRQMAKLQTLDVSYNNMTGMPAEIGQLHSLQTLDYSHNQITGLPDELSNLKSNLKTFNLTGNPLSQPQITKLKSELPDTTIIF